MDVLIVDDCEADIRALTREFVRSGRGDWEVCAARTLNQMRTLLDERRFDVAVVDYMLGHEYGLEALPALQAAGVPGILVTGAGEPTLGARAIKAGFAEYVAKGVRQPTTYLLNIVLKAERLAGARK